MRKKYVVIASVCMLSGLCPCLKSQTLPPDQWETFISENNNTLVSDTFRLQTFGGAIQDNWKYQSQGTTSVIESSASGIEGVSGGKLLKQSLNTTLHFENARSPLHSSIKGGLAYAPKGMMIGENMNVVIYHGSGMETIEHSKISANNFSSKMINIKINREHLYAIDLQTAPPAVNTTNGYYVVDSVYLFGDIAHYSLFKGKGNWNNATAWSHLPAERHRHGLVKGDVTVTTDTHCDTVSLKGSIKINPNTKLSVKQLFVHDAPGSIINEGDLLLDGQFNLIRSFSQKGAWYFVSFPFDVYADGIDPAFTLKDETPNSGGNYIYVLTYDSEKRNNEMTTRDNWNVMPATAAFDNSPLFEKNKGYLLAIDELADKTSLCFSSRKGDIPQFFGKSGQLNIDIPYARGGNDVHFGWQFCGNPLPAPLHVSKLDHPDLDGYVYFYNGENYTAIPVTENYSIPPYAPFFLKANKSLSITVGAEEEEGGILLSAPSPLSRTLGEPAAGNPTGSTPVSKFEFCRLTETTFHINNAPQKGTVQIFNAAGLQVSSFVFSAGESGQFPLPAQSGFYVLLIQTQKGRMEYKIVR